MRSITVRLRTTTVATTWSSGGKYIGREKCLISKVFRKKYPGLFPKVSLDRLEEIEENVYSKCTYCKYDPKSGGGGGGGNGGGNGGGRSKSKGKKSGGGANRSSGSSRRSGGGSKAAAAAGGRKSNRNGNRGGQSSGARGGNQKNSEYQTQIKNGNIPGAAGKDYPTFSLKQLEKKGFKGIQPAPEDLIPKDYPKQGGARRSGQKSGQRSGQRPGSKSGQRSGGGGKCPGSLDDCMGACPSDMRVFKVCVKSCSSRCAKK